MIVNVLILTLIIIFIDCDYDCDQDHEGEGHNPDSVFPLSHTQQIGPRTCENTYLRGGGAGSVKDGDLRSIGVNKIGIIENLKP